MNILFLLDVWLTMLMFVFVAFRFMLLLFCLIECMVIFL